MKLPRPALALTAPLVLLAVAACGGGPNAGAGSSPGGSVTVYAAASLTEAFTDLARAFEDAHPGTSVQLNFGASSSLREQVLAGAPADVLATADTADMDQLVAAGAVSGPRVLASNRLQIAVPAGNPAGVSGLADFADGDLLLGLCAAQVPCGRLARQALVGAGVTPAVDTDAADARALLTQVRSGDLDAGIVYRTDVLAAGDAVEGVDIPADHNVVVDYPIAVLADAADPRAAAAFVEFALSGDGRAIMASHGFDAA